MYIDSQIPFITAEIGINHNGDINIAKKLIDMAVRCGCDAVKFQKRTVEDCYTEEFLDSPRESPWGTTQREQKEGLELDDIEYNTINSYCKKKGIDWYASAWDIDSQLFLRDYNLKYNKIASKMIDNTEFLKVVADEKKPTFISTGSADFNRICDVMDIFSDCDVTLMHCVPLYPCPIDKCNLDGIYKLKLFGKVGYSCHCPSILPTTVATILGAVALEKHITLDRTMYGTDQPASVEERGLYLMVRDAKNVNLLF
jgi:N-acetylneuraminate synthase